MELPQLFKPGTRVGVIARGSNGEIFVMKNLVQFLVEKGIKPVVFCSEFANKYFSKYAEVKIIT